MPPQEREQSDVVDKLVKRHPLQRLESPTIGVSALVHIVGLISYSYSFHYELLPAREEIGAEEVVADTEKLLSLSTHPNHINQSYGWHFQYLTIIGLAMSTLTFALGLLSDITLSRNLFLVKNILSMSAAPLSTLISFLYWGLRAIDPELVVPKEFDLPLLPDLAFHAFPSILLLIDLLLLSPPWTITAVPALGLSAVIAFAYWFWIELCYSKNGFYPYPLFTLLNTYQRMGLFGASAVVMAGSTAVLKWVYRKVNGMEGESRVGDVKKRA